MQSLLSYNSFAVSLKDRNANLATSKVVRAWWAMFTVSVVLRSKTATNSSVIFSDYSSNLRGKPAVVSAVAADVYGIAAA